MIFCAAGDPGGSRALLPVIETLANEAMPCTVLEHGFLGTELPAAFRHRLCPPEEAEQTLERCRAFLFGSSACDTVPLTLARLADAKGIPVVHVLDNWGTYLGRLCTDGLAPLVPAVYAVLDEEARRGALAEGVPESCLVVSGHPGMAETARVLDGLLTTRQTAFATRHGQVHIAFVNEPFASVLGTDITAPNHPGFTEDRVLAAFCQALQPMAGNIFVSVLPHPKQDEEIVNSLWQHVRGDLQGRVTPPGRGREILAEIDGVAGMASILLYEAWLCGIPVLALQPQCKLDSMRRFALLAGIDYSNDWLTVPPCIKHWLSRCAAGIVGPSRPELALHADAPMRIAKILRDLAGKST